MLSRLIILFVTLPLIELLILIKLGEWIGFWPTIALVVVTGIIGASLAKIQGLLALNRIRQELALGRVPADELVDGLLILIGGIVLLTPGILTDLFGFAMLVSPIRTFTKQRLKHHFGHMMKTGKVSQAHKGFGGKAPEFTDDFRVED